MADTVIKDPPSIPTTYRANCHCGHTRFTITLPNPFPIYPINRCTCSICSKNGYLLVYPHKKDVQWISGSLCSISCPNNLHNHLRLSSTRPHLLLHFIIRSLPQADTDPESGYEDLGEYRMGKKQTIHKFCRICGSSMLLDFCYHVREPDEPEKDEIAVNVSLLFHSYFKHFARYTLRVRLA